MCFVLRAALSLGNSLKWFLRGFGPLLFRVLLMIYPIFNQKVGIISLSIIKYCPFYVSYLMTDHMYVTDFQGYSPPLWVVVKTTRAAKCDLKRLPMAFQFFMTTISCKYKMNRDCLTFLHLLGYISIAFQLTWSCSSTICLLSFTVSSGIHSQPLRSREVCFIQYPLTHAFFV